MRSNLLLSTLTLCLVLAAAVTVHAESVTGNPIADGWAYAGHSLENGVYVRGSANYGFEMYSAALTVTADSNLFAGSGSTAWLVGDSVLGVGGRFTTVTAAEAGWTTITGGAVNGLLNEGTKLIAKFGTAEANFSASSVAPASGDGAGSTSNAATGGVFVRSSGWFYAADWMAGAGTLQDLDKASHISRNGTTAPDMAVAQLIWTWNSATQSVGTWEILLNVSLLERLAPESFTGLAPAAGDLAVMSVQQRDSAYTDSMLTIVPEPATMSLLGLGLAALVARRRRNK